MQADTYYLIEFWTPDGWVMSERRASFESAKELADFYDCDCHSHYRITGPGGVAVYEKKTSLQDFTGAGQGWWNK